MSPPPERIFVPIICSRVSLNNKLLILLPVKEARKCWRVDSLKMILELSRPKTKQTRIPHSNWMFGLSGTRTEPYCSPLSSRSHWHVLPEETGPSAAPSSLCTVSCLMITDWQKWHKELEAFSYMDERNLWYSFRRLIKGNRTKGRSEESRLLLWLKENCLALDLILLGGPLAIFPLGYDNILITNFWVCICSNNAGAESISTNSIQETQVVSQTYFTETLTPALL